MGDLTPLDASPRVISRRRLSTIVAYRGLTIKPYVPEFGGGLLQISLIAPFDLEMSPWMRAVLLLRFRPQGHGQPIVYARPLIAYWRHDEQTYWVKVAPLIPLFSTVGRIFVDVGFADVWRTIPLFDPYAVRPEPPPMDFRLITHRIEEMKMRYPPFAQPATRSTLVNLEVDTTWSFVSWLRGNAAVRLTLKGGSMVEADVLACDPYLVGTRKISAIFDALIRSADVEHVDLVIPTSPTTEFVHRLL